MAPFAVLDFNGLKRPSASASILRFIFKSSGIESSAAAPEHHRRNNRAGLSDEAK